jgi:class 3 adenylate cyclase
MPSTSLWVSALSVGVILAVMVWCALAMRGRKRGKFPGRCGKCGYNVTGLTNFTCPECGSDLRAVGIVRGDKTLKPSKLAVLLGVQLTAWTLLYTALYGFLGANSYPNPPERLASRKIEYGLLDAYWWPYKGKSTHIVTLRPTAQCYTKLTVTENREAKFHGWRRYAGWPGAPTIRWTGNSPPAGITAHTVTLECEPPEGPPGLPRPPTAALTVDPRTLAWSYDDPQTPGKRFSGAPLTTDVLTGWLGACGAILSSPSIADETLALLDLIKDSAANKPFPNPTGTKGRLEAVVVAHQASGLYAAALGAYPFTVTFSDAQDFYGPAWSIYWLSVPFGLGVYTYGANWIWARYRLLSATRRKSAHHARTLTILFCDLKDHAAKAITFPREALVALLAANRQVVEASVHHNNGTVIKTIGDAYLVTFESATDAVRAGMQIQKGASAYNAGRLEPDQRLEYRVAVCTGEVLFTGGDVFGTPVSVAARVQSVVEPGEVYFTESTLHAINAPDVPHEEVGPRELAGIPAPVRLFKALGPEDAAIETKP